MFFISKKLKKQNIYETERMFEYMRLRNKMQENHKSNLTSVEELREQRELLEEKLKQDYYNDCIN